MSELRSSPSGIVVYEEDGKFILSPAGNLDLSDIVIGEDSRVPSSPLRIHRSSTLLLSITSSGQMFVSPAGEVDLSKIKIDPSLRVTNGSRLEVSLDGTIKRTYTNNVLEATLSLKKNTVAKGTLDFKKKPMLSKTSQRGSKEVVISPRDGQVVFSPAGSIRIPKEDPLKINSELAYLWYIMLGEDGEMNVGSPECVEDINNWIQLF